eukprot:TRINITY_DN8299_c0_g2_i1.p1 TRINITY_DN8299_c0_g2~~TRINITY_DN8299_c0_g2_i1.p1  ORF type:complete len:740 (-),score=186.15 TRINITY_DN8299_c0_g2_i1:497-2716(-)
MSLKYLSSIGIPVPSAPIVQLGLPEATIEDISKQLHPQSSGKDASGKDGKAAAAKAESKAGAKPKAAPKSSAEKDAKTNASADPKESKNFLQVEIDKTLAKGGRCASRAGKAGDVIRTRFPPEPNGYLHIGHAKSICINFGLAKQYGGRCHLRFDDTNPAAEETEYVDSIQEDVKWLGFDWGENLFFASSYFDQLYEWAEHLIKEGKAYVDSQSAEDIRKNRGNVTTPGTDSPFRSRTADENLKLFREMKAGKYKEGEHLLRAKIDMTSPNMNMRDPPMYRILHKEHHRTGNKWCIYPLYDFAHGQEDAIEGITHSICTLEFEAHRELYNWYRDNLPVKEKPHQYEFARLNVTNMVMSKRKLLRLVKEQVVDGWDDPRMPTICGMRRRGVTPEALRNFVTRIGVTTSLSTVDIGLLEETIREDLEPKVHRRMAVLYPIKVVIEDYPDGKVEEVTAANHPSRPEDGSRSLKFAKEIYIDREDFMEDPPESYFRLKPGGEVKLRACYVIKCKEVKKGKNGEIVELRCTHDPATRDTMPADRKVKGVIHWVSAKHCIRPKVRLYNYLLRVGTPGEEASPVVEEDDDDDGKAAKDDFMKDINPDSLEELKDACLEESLKDAKPGERFQFERTAFFVCDKYSKANSLVFNRIVGLKESSAKPDKDASADARSRKDAQAKALAEKDAKKKLDPKDMFKSQTDLYSKFDDDGVPTHAADGEPLPKARIKKLKQEWEKQKKLFESNK